MDWRFSCYDVTDDGGLLVREMFPDSDALPHFVKEASYPRSLPREDWALAYDDDSTSLRKFAMSDRGNTWLSTMYFVRTGNALPDPLVKSAAVRLTQACKDYGLAPPEELGIMASGERAQATVSPEYSEAITKIAMHRSQEAAATREVEIMEDGYSPKTKIASSIIDENALVSGLQMRLMYFPADERPALTTALEKVAMTGPALVSFISDLDQRSGLFQHWGGDLPDPHDTVYGTGPAPAPKEKVAKKVFQVGGSVVTDVEIEKLAASEKFTDAFPTAFVSQFREDPVTVFDSLPRDTQAVIASLAKG